MKKLIVFVFAMIVTFGSAWSQTLRRGDLNGDGEVSLADLTKLADILIGRHEYVDLGLPSGTLWATCNVGANFPEEYGDYFSFGETEPKSDYTWSTYKWCEGTESTMTKYCLNEAYGTVDSLEFLALEDDAARANWGGEWRMPTKAQLNELTEEFMTWDFNANVNGVAGVLLTSRSNGNTLFLPYAGYYNGTTLIGKEHHAAIRGCNVTNANISSYRWWRTGDVVTFNGTRCYGTTIRPVLNVNTSGE